MYDARTRAAVAQYARGLSTAREAAEGADVSTAELRYYTRTCGIAPAFSGTDADLAGGRRRHGARTRRRATDG